MHLADKFQGSGIHHSLKAGLTVLVQKTRKQIVKPDLFLRQNGNACTETRCMIDAS